MNLELCIAFQGRNVNRLAEYGSQFFIFVMYLKHPKIYYCCFHCYGLILPATVSQEEEEQSGWA
jgi:hypothetical protein